MNRFWTLSFVLAALLSAGANAQVRPREEPDQTVVSDPTQREMLETIEVKYQGGLFGYSKKEHGTIKFDDINERLSFYGKDGKERFSIPYSSIVVVYPSQTKVQSGTGRAVGAIPFPGAGIGGLFMKKKKNYLVVNYDDQDVDAKGAINFLVDTPEILFNSIYTIGEKAEMKPRGDSYIRKKDY
ncbi:MAG: hypothetical protein OEM82_00240 [Acidobacteriota bacterium]|nr:hypothetical protein [Acidobacteriota bacterium]MDH3530962.1 hypothetical protein [Acidobacteriota bacterium]